MICVVSQTSKATFFPVKGHVNTIKPLLNYILCLSSYNCQHGNYLNRGKKKNIVDKEIERKRFKY